jgi:acyl carrier protein
MSNVNNQTLTQTSLTPTESTLADMWRDLLGREKSEPNDDFFVAGGTSLTAIKLLQRVEKEFGPEVLSPDTLYSDPKLGSVARAIDEAVGK